MFAGLIRIPRLLAGGLALAALLCWVPVSQAAVFTGSATDPAGDLWLDVGDDLPSPPVDFTHVTVRYDDVAGRVDVSYTFDQAPASDQELEASVALGFVERDGSCSTPTFTSRHWHGPLGEGSTGGQVAVVGTFARVCRFCKGQSLESRLRMPPMATSRRAGNGRRCSIGLVLSTRPGTSRPSTRRWSATPTHAREPPSSLGGSRGDRRGLP